MAAWTSDELERIAKADELHIASRRRDGALRDPVTVWVVRDGDDLYVRSVNGRTGSFAAGTRLVQAISERPGVDEQRPDVDLRHDGVTVRMVAFVQGYGGMTRGHAELARKISGAARSLGLSADPSKVQSLLVIP